MSNRRPARTLNTTPPQTPNPEQEFTTEAQSSAAFDRAHAEVRNQIVLVLVLEARWHQLDRVCAPASFRLLCRPPVLRRCASCDRRWLPSAALISGRVAY